MLGGKLLQFKEIWVQNAYFYKGTSFLYKKNPVNKKTRKWTMKYDEISYNLADSSVMGKLMQINKADNEVCLSYNEFSLWSLLYAWT
jgi:hypothetical protein